MTTNAETGQGLTGRSQEVHVAGEAGTTAMLAHGQPPQADARAIVTQRLDALDPHRRQVVLLVVDCPFCGKLHIHSGGHVEQVVTGVRQARCVGTSTETLRYDVQVVTAA